jgi:hypothetical protein
MPNLEELGKAVTNLPEDDYRQFRRWFLKIDWERCDRQVIEDSREGRFCFLVGEARDAKKKNELGDL